MYKVGAINIMTDSLTIGDYNVIYTSTTYSSLLDAANALAVDTSVQALDLSILYPSFSTSYEHFTILVWIMDSDSTIRRKTTPYHLIINNNNDSNSYMEYNATDTDSMIPVFLVPIVGEVFLPTIDDFSEYNFKDSIFLYINKYGEDLTYIRNEIKNDSEFKTALLFGVIINGVSTSYMTLANQTLNLTISYNQKKNGSFVGWTTISSPYFLKTTVNEDSTHNTRYFSEINVNEDYEYYVVFDFFKDSKFMDIFNDTKVSEIQLKVVFIKNGNSITNDYITNSITFT